MDADMPTAPTPIIRSAVTVPRSRAAPIAAPRTTMTSAAPRTTTAVSVQTSDRNDTRTLASSPSPPSDPHRLRCPLCRRSHRLQHCGIFKSMPPLRRHQVTQAHGYCLNCLAHTHTTQECMSDGLCQRCGRLHHTLLHRDNGHSPTPRNHAALRRPESSLVPQHRRPITNRDPPSWRPYTKTTTRRRQPRQQSRRLTGLSTVVETLQQLQRLLG
ncbi:uncharacterized protein LOC128923037 [Zeugodacus cucurbitae]|uniref:uncharacterized protein LOC128923037 n=1 Tax=Zeugodacus cucurbitae TaxID=28588 RepID=UPI0023D945FE|nr:uncharacterized protein LOC128923037 [Zeugodacus cucurbitae]